VNERSLWSFDSVVLTAVAADLEPLVGAPVTRVLQPDRDEIALAIGGRKRSAYVLLSIHPRWARVHLTDSVESGIAASFCQLLRARLEGARLQRIVQPAFERTVTLAFNPLGGAIDVIAEIMGRRSNLIAVSGGTILGALKPVTAAMSSVRQILPGLAYAPPPRDRPVLPELTPDALRTLLAGSTGPLARRLAGTVLGLSPLLATELVVRAGLASPSPGRSADEESAALWPVITELIRTVGARQFAPMVYATGDEPVGFTPFPYIHLADRSGARAPRMSDAVAIVAARVTRQSRLEEHRTLLRAVIVSAMAKLTHTLGELRRSKQEADAGEELRSRGDLLFAYASQIPARAAAATLPGFDDRPVTIELDPTLTAAENARAMFTRYAKMKAARPGIERRFAEVTALTEYLDSVLTMVDTAASVDDLAALRAELVDEGMLKARRSPRTRRAQTSGPRTFTASSGHEIIVGRTNRENDEVTFTLARPTDLWLHARGMPGAHVIVRSGGRPIPDATIREAAQIAAYFSRGRSGGRVPVSYTLRKYVKKPRGAKPGLAAITNEKTVMVEPRLPQSAQASKRAIGQS
jgi:predicted ribosome quality control (RQC) complex YloA/Tae2 family protein